MAIKLDYHLIKFKTYQKNCSSSFDLLSVVITMLLVIILFIIFHLLHSATSVTAAASFKHETISFSGFDYGKDGGNFTFVGDKPTIDGGALQLTPDTANVKYINDYYNKSGRIMYHRSFKLFNDADNMLASFNSTFVINLFRSSEWNSGHGLAFLIASNDSFLPESSYGQWLGLTNASTDGNKGNQFVAIEFDTAKQDFDPDDNHLGLNINSVVSKKNVPLKDYNITLSDSNSYTIWVQYDGKSELMQVFMEREGKSKPQKPLLNQTINLKEYLKPESYFGFSASTGYPQIQLNCVRSWTLDIDYIKNEKDQKWLIISVGVGVPVLTIVLLFLCAIVYVKKRRSRANVGESHELGKLKLPGMPREFKYKELKKATNNFHENMRLGEGGFGIVYRGIINDENNDDNTSTTQIAVKVFSRDSIKSKGDFLAELAIIHRLRHRHLVRLVGWCHEKGKLLLVYDFMPNGSLEKYLYGTSEQVTLNWDQRYKVLTGVASALHYLQNEYDQKVVHRDLKASNILLDIDFNARLGDFGLARAIDNERNSYAEHGLLGVPGTLGYVAPECFHMGKATPESDVFSFGVVVLEVICGRSPGIMIPHQQHSYSLVDWVWMLHREGHIQDAVDKRLNIDSVDDEAKRLLLLGLACSHPIDSERPKTEEILRIISQTLPAPYVPPFKPAFIWPSTNLSINMFDSILSSEASSVSSGVSKSQNALSRLPI